MAAAHQQAALAGLRMDVDGFNLGLGSPGLGGMLNMAQLTRLDGMNGMNPLGVNINMLGTHATHALGRTTFVSTSAQSLSWSFFFFANLVSFFCI